MAKIKIAHIITELELGGAQKTTLSLLEHINKDDYEPYLITSPGGLLAEEARSAASLKIFLIPSFCREIDPVKDIVSFCSILKYLKKEGISVVHTHSSKAGIIGRWAAKFAGAAYIFHTVHGWPFHIETDNPARFFYMLLEKITSWVTTRIVVVSDADLKAGLKYINKNRKKYVKIYYGIETSLFLNKNPLPQQKDGFLLQKFNIKKETVIVGFISCFKPQKAPLDFIRVARLVANKCKDARFICAGDGVLRPEAEKLSSELGLGGDIKFLGWQKDIPRLFSIVDILILTSRWEGLPVVFLEAMASGVPIVATDVGGASEVVKSGFNGFLEAKGACEKMADDIIFLVNNSDKRREFSENSRRSFRKEFDISYMAQQLQSLYKQTVNINRGIQG